MVGDGSQTWREYRAKWVCSEIWKMQTSQQWLPKDKRESGRLHTSRRHFSSGGHVPRCDCGGTYMHIHTCHNALNCILVFWTCVLYTPKARSWRKFSSRSPPASTMVLATKKDVEKEQLLHHEGSRGEMLLNACQCINEAWYYSIIGPLSHSKQNQGCGGMIDRFQQV